MKYEPPGNTEIRMRQIGRQVEQIDRKLAELPEGTANVYTFSNGRTRIKGTIDGVTRYFRKDETDLAKALVYRKYLLIKKEELLHRKDLLSAKSEFEHRWLGLSEKYLTENPERTSLLSGYLTGGEQSLTQWMKAPASDTAPCQEGRTEDSAAGYKVRSKSEVMIVSVLLEQGLFFRYEDPLSINGTTYYPDFTIRNPKDGRIYWYEHFGRMDDPGYVRKAYSKLTDYAACGLVPHINLIVTFETGHNKLNLSQIKRELLILDRDISP